ncbi:MAG: hypothetical protein OXI16_13710 [Chloroflexota bacterium]|nr:hypothetical protein [Chloroflexota bacterium]
MKKSVTERLLRWYCTGETGLSSEAIARTAAGHPLCSDKDSRVPYDAWDVRRCILLIREVPEAFELGVMVLASKYDSWAALAANWTQIEASLTAEIGNDLNTGSCAPRTYKLVRSLLDEVRAAKRLTPEYMDCKCDIMLIC